MHPTTQQVPPTHLLTTAIAADFVLKTYLALEMAFAVASGRPCVRHDRVADPGPALLFIAEDSPGDVGRRLAGIAALAGASLAGVPLHVVTDPQLRIDQPGDQHALEATLRALHPRLLILDPFVRLHGGSGENAVSAVAPILGFLSALQRSCSVAIALVHHQRKQSPPCVAARRSSAPPTSTPGAISGSARSRGMVATEVFERSSGAASRPLLTSSPNCAPTSTMQHRIPLALRVGFHLDPSKPEFTYLDTRSHSPLVWRSLSASSLPAKPLFEQTAAAQFAHSET